MPAYFKYLLTLLLINSYGTAFTGTKEHFSVNYQIVLPETIKTALKNYDSSFVTYKANDFSAEIISSYPFRVWQSPSAVIGDFNGDKMFDVVFLGYNAKHRLAIGIVSNKNTYKATEIIKLDLPNKDKINPHKNLTIYLSLVPDRKFPDEIKGNINAGCNAFQIIKQGKGAVLYYYQSDENRFSFYKGSKPLFYNYKDDSSFLSASEWKQSYKNEMPRIKYSMSFSSRIQSIIKKCSPDFETWDQDDYIPIITKLYEFSPKQLLSAVVGDFNGDKVSDAILTGHSKKINSISMTILSNGNDYKLHDCSNGSYVDPQKEWYTGELGFFSYLEYVPPKKFEGIFSGYPLELKRDAYKWDVFEKTSSLYYFDGKNFKEYLISD
ncbi:MAG: hypothetical protein HY746_04465 [Elusimicrobia bacterium]|nr:hypothetical protein [Elusimicrobiota bacterium]